MRRAELLHLQAELVGLGEVLGALDRALLVEAGGEDLALQLRAVVAVEEAVKGLDRAGESVGVLVALREEIVILLVRKIGIDRDRAVEEDLQLSRAGIEVRGRAEDDHVCALHFLEDRRGIVLDDALVCLLTGVAARAVADLLLGNADLRDLVARLLRALRERITKEIGIPALTRGR